MIFRNCIIKKSSGHVAKERLRRVLISDIANCSPDIIEQLRTDMINVVSKYFEITDEKATISLTYNPNDKTLIEASLPIKEMKVNIR